MTYHKLILSAGLALSILMAPSGALAQNINFGDNTSTWANDGECDDPRFTGNGMADVLLDEDIRHDANDCRQLFSKGRITEIPVSQKGNRINFGDNAGEWTNDGECDDPRFGGAGMASILLDEDIGHDANDCRTLLNSGQIYVLGQGNISATINYGDDASQWAHDGECDDPRFSGPGTASTLLDSDLGHDATDCRMLLQQGQIDYTGQGKSAPVPQGNAQINFGDNTSTWAHDDECDDPRFSGSGMANILLDEDIGHDAADCQYLYQSNQIEYIGSGSNSTSSPAAMQGASVNGKYQNLLESYECPVDVISGDHGTFQDYGYWSGGTDCGVSGTHPAGYYVWYNERWYVWAAIAGANAQTGTVDLCPSTALGLTQSLICQCSAEAASNGSRLWGTGLYTSDSHICRAAVHAGQISTNGGRVQIFPEPGRQSYHGSTQYGLTSNDWGSYGESFRF